MKAYFHEIDICQDPTVAIMSVLWKMAMMQKETALSLHANSTGVATEGFFQVLSPSSVLLLLA